MSDYDFDMQGLREAKAEAEDLKTNRGPLATRFDKLEEIYFMDYKGSGPDDTISPSGRNRVDYAVMLLTAAMPKFNVPKDKNNPDAERASSKIEKALNKMYAASNSEQSMVVETELAFTGFMYDEMSVRVTSTKDLMEATKQAAEADKQGKKAKEYNEKYWEAEIKSAERRMEKAAYLDMALYPKVCHPLFSRNELLALYTVTERRVIDVRKDYGDRVAGLADMQEWKTVTEHEWLDKSHRYTWLDEQEQPVYAEPHGLGFLPGASTRVKGKHFFDKEERRNEPFLFSLLTSGIWPAENKMLTAWVENVTKLINAGFVFKPETPDGELETIHHDIIGNVLKVNGTLTPMSKELINRDSLELWQLVENIVGESTMQSQDAGVGGSAPFSMVALLSQIRRLPVIPVQKGLQNLLAQVGEIHLRWMVNENRNYGELTWQEIPDVVDIDVVVEPDLPQDKVQMLSLANDATSGDDPLLPKRWAREFLGEGQSDELQEEIWAEIAASKAYQALGEQLIQELIGGGQGGESAGARGQGTGAPGEGSQESGVGSRPTPMEGMPVNPQVMPDEMQPQEAPGA